MWIFFLKNKYEVFSKFLEFKALVENQIGKKVKVLRSYNEGEYISNALEDLCAKEGIRTELTPPYNPRHNEVADHKNQSNVA